MSSDEGLDAYGAATWGQFFIYQGFNPHIGWMHTSSGVDNVDEFAETRRSARQRSAATGTAPPAARMGARPVTIRYRTATAASGRAASRPGCTHRGPIVARAQGRWIAFAMMNKPVEALQQSFLRTKATDLASFMRISDLKANSSNNTVFADDKGEIAYLAPAVRAAARQPFRLYAAGRRQRSRAPTGGSCTRCRELPNTINPPTGWVDQQQRLALFGGRRATSPEAGQFPALHGHGRRKLPRRSTRLRLLTGSRGLEPR